MLCFGSLNHTHTNMLIIDLIGQNLLRVCLASYVFYFLYCKNCLPKVQLCNVTANNISSKNLS